LSDILQNIEALGVEMNFVRTAAIAICAFLSTVTISHSADCTYSSDGKTFCPVGSKSPFSGGETVRPFVITEVKFNPKLHSDDIYCAVDAYRKQTNGSLGQDDYYVPLIVDPKAHATVSDLDCVGVSFQRWLGALIGVQKGEAVAVSFTANYQGPFGSNISPGDQQALGNGSSNIDPTSNKIAGQCAATIAAGGPLKFIRFGGATKNKLFPWIDRYQVNLKTSQVQVAQFNAVATLTSVLNKALAALSIATSQKIALPSQDTSAYTDVASVVESALQGAVGGQFSQTIAYGLDASGPGTAGLNITVNGKKSIAGSFDITAFRMGSAFTLYTGSGKTASQILRFRFYDSSTKSALDKLADDAVLKTYLDDGKLSEKYGPFCRNVRTFTSETLPLAVADAALTRWAILKYLSVFDQIGKKDSKYPVNEECFSPEDAYLVGTIFPFTKVSPAGPAIAGLAPSVRFAEYRVRRAQAAVQIAKLKRAIRLAQTQFVKLQRVEIQKAKAAKKQAAQNAARQSVAFLQDARPAESGARLEATP
jgi:hypothetical protein